MKVLLILISISYFFFPVNACSGPFGVNMDDPEEQFADSETYTRKRELGEYTIYNSLNIPKEHPLFFDYLYWFKNKKLCAVDGVTKWLNETNALETVDILKEKLISKYGDIITIDDRNITNMKSIKETTTLVTYYWHPPKNNLDNLIQIELSLLASTHGRFFSVDLRYIFKNYFKQKHSDTYDQ